MVLLLIYIFFIIMMPESICLDRPYVYVHTFKTWSSLDVRTWEGGAGKWQGAWLVSGHIDTTYNK